MKYYDNYHKCLIYLQQKPTPHFWDSLWQKKNPSPLSEKFDLLVVPTTKKYLPQSSVVLEGGCGRGLYVNKLDSAGYKCIGVDFAKRTIKENKKKWPDLKFVLANLEKLPFPSNMFDGYWSLGVIEHFFEGFEKMGQEMKRVIKPNGYLFITFPYLSPLRKLKIKLNRYPALSFNKKPMNFYQFALDASCAIEQFEKMGFTLIEKKPFDGFRGLKEEVSQLELIVNPISHRAKSNLLFAVLRFIISKMTQSFTSHCVLLVFSKN